MKVEAYIRELLYRHECVIIPGLGAILANRKSAMVHQTTHAFYPPKKVLSFNTQITESDGVLANYISKAEDTSYSEATEKIRDFVEQFQQLLNSSQEITLEQVGTFSLTENNKINFQPFYHENYLAESFGLSAFTSSEIKREEVVEETTTEETETPVITLENNEDKVESIEPTDTSASENSTSSTKSKRTPIWGYAAASIAVLGLAGFLGFNAYQNNIENHNIAQQKEAEQQIESNIQQATFVIDNPLPEVTLTLERPKGKYHIVAGAFREKANAEKKVKQLRQNGFKAREIGANKYGLYQVVYTSIENRLEALKTLREIKSNSNPEAWLLVQEL